MDDAIYLDTWLTSHLVRRSRWSCHQSPSFVKGCTHCKFQLHIMSESWTISRDRLFMWSLVNSYEWYWEIAVWYFAQILAKWVVLRNCSLIHAQILSISNLGVSKCFYEKFVTLLTLPKIHEKILNHSADIKIFVIGKGLYRQRSKSTQGPSIIFFAWNSRNARPIPQTYPTLSFRLLVILL